MPDAHSQMTFFLLRGLTREIRHWGRFLPRLKKADPNIHVTPLEIPGTGMLRKIRSPLQIKKYTEAARNQFLSQRIPGNINIIVGFSFGGMIAADWLASHADDFNGAVLINTSCRKSPFLKRCKTSGGIKLIRALAIRDSYNREKLIAELICNQADVVKVAQHWAEIRRSAPVSTLNAFRQLYAAATFALPENVTTPCLLLCSKKDRLVSHQCSEDIANIWKSKIIYHDHAGHDLTTDDPDWCIETLLSWLTGTIV